MKIHLIRKEKGKVYKSADIVDALFGYGLDHDDDRAPHLTGPGSEGLFISISDTVNYWACCIEPHNVGLDMEERSRRVKPAIARKLHKAEQEYLSVLSEGGSEWTEEFLSIWTRKEAWSKYKGAGLSLGFSSFSVLDGCIEGVPVASFTYKDLIFGIAGDTEAVVQRTEYDAPFAKSALEYGADLLDVRGYSSGELRKKLEDRGYGPEEAAQAIEKFKEYGYINDEEYAGSAARKGSESGKSSRRVETELKRKGLDAETARNAAEELKEGDYERALAEARKMLEKLGGLPSVGREDDIGSTEEARERVREAYAKRQKIYGKISRRLSALGYEASVIYSVTEELARW
ncbi:MAG: RecX family transcriptional regulator [Firmicutes bacterium]|nr:RecX family transcriptional regulator [Bacillota bacterium]